LDWRRLRRFRRASVVVAIAVIVLVVVIVVVVFVVPVVVFIVLVVFVVLLAGLGTRPAFRLLGKLEVQLLPGFVVDLLHVAVLVLQFDELGVLVDRQDLEHLFVVEAFVPLAGYGIVISAHGLPRLPARAAGPRSHRYYGRRPTPSKPRA
jgi:hypothetical protein